MASAKLAQPTVAYRARPLLLLAQALAETPAEPATVPAAEPTAAPTVGAPRTDAQLAADARDVVGISSRAAGAVHNCLRSLDRGGDGLRLMYTLTLDPKGRVSEAVLTDPTLPDAEAACIQAPLLRLRFPRWLGDTQQTVTFSFGR